MAEESVHQALQNVTSEAVSGAVSSVSKDTGVVMEGIRLTFGTVTYAILLIIGAWVLVWALTKVLTFLSEKVGGKRIMIKMIIPLIKLLIWIAVIFLVITSIVDFSSVNLLAFSGLLGAALGFGLKDVVGDFVGGIAIIIEQPFKVGDKIYFGDTYGEVKDIGLRATRIITPDDTEYSIPNYKVFTDSVGSSNSGKMEMMIVVDLFVHPGADTEKGVGIVREAIISSPYVIVKEHLSTVLVTDMPYARRIRAKMYVLDLRDEFECASDITRRSWTAFEKEGIRPPVLPADCAFDPRDYGVPS